MACELRTAVCASCHFRCIHQDSREGTTHGHRVDCGGTRFFRRLLWAGQPLRQPACGGLNMDWTMWLAILIAVGLVVYLAAALLIPEKFS